MYLDGVSLIIIDWCGEIHGGLSVSGGDIIDITPDDGATLYTATFSATGAGISPGGATLILEVS